jgi:hypothetical protein
VETPHGLPAWLRFSSGLGLFFFAAYAIVPRLMSRAESRVATGTEGDPYPPHESPPANLYLTPTPTPTKGSALGKVLERRWRSLHQDELSREQAAILVAQSAISTNYGSEMLSFNPIMSRADRFYRHPWTVQVVPEWKHHKPAFRYAPIKVYPSLDAGVYAWLKDLSPSAIAAIRANDPSAYAKEVARMGEAETLIEIYEPELVGIRNRLLLPQDQRVPLPIVAT